MGLSDYMINGKKDGNSYVFTLHKSLDKVDADNNIKFSLSPLTKESFIKNFFRSFALFQDKISDGKTGVIIPSAKGLVYDVTMLESKKIKTPGYKLLEDEATKLFYLFVARSIVYDDLGKEPIAGTLFYVDSLWVLRRDVDHALIDNNIKRLWKVYKKEKKTFYKVLKTGVFDKNLDNNTSKSKAKINEAFIDYNRKNNKNESADSLKHISGMFNFRELLANRNKRKFSKFEEKEYLKDRSKKQQKKYDEVLDKLSIINDDLLVRSDSLTIYNNTLEILNSLQLIEKKKQILFEQLRKDHIKVKDDINEIELAKDNIYHEIKIGITIYKSRPDHFDKSEFHERLETLNADLIKPYRTCISSSDNVTATTEIKWRKKDCDNISSILYFAIEKEKSQILGYLEHEKQYLETVSYTHLTLPTNREV